MNSSGHDGISEAIRASMQARFCHYRIKWSKTTLKIMNGYRSRWNQAARGDDPEAVGQILIELWDRLVMHPDDANTRLGLAQVGVEFVLTMHISSQTSGVPLAEVYESLGGTFYEIREGRCVSYEITNAAGEKRKLTFERGERRMTLPGGAPVPSN